MSAPTNPPVPYAVLGWGYIGRRHGAHLAAMPSAHLVGVVDPDAQARTHAEAQGHPAYATWQDLVGAQGAPFAASVCTPNHLHAPLAIQALDAGSHVVVEKPMALTVADAQAMAQAAQRHQRRLGVMLQNRYSPAVHWLQQLVASGRLGTIHQLAVRCYWNRDGRYYQQGSWRGTWAQDGGPLFTQFSHFIDLLHWLFGPLHVAGARRTHHRPLPHRQVEDGGQVWFSLPGGGLGSLVYATSAPEQNYGSNLEILAEHGTIHLGGQYMNDLLHCQVKGMQPPTLPASPPANQYAGYTGSAANHGLFLADALAWFQGQPLRPGHQALVDNATDGLAAVAFIEEAYALAGPPIQAG